MFLRIHPPTVVVSYARRRGLPVSATALVSGLMFSRPDEDAADAGLRGVLNEVRDAVAQGVHLYREADPRTGFICGCRFGASSL
jgi:hypothetical protein